MPKSLREHLITLYLEELGVDIGRPAVRMTDVFEGFAVSIKVEPIPQFPRLTSLTLPLE